MRSRSRPRSPHGSPQPRTPLLVTIHGISKANEPLASILLRGPNVRLTAVSEAAAAGLLKHAWAPSVDILGPGIDIEEFSRQATSATRRS